MKTEVRKRSREEKQKLDIYQLWWSSLLISRSSQALKKEWNSMRGKARDEKKTWRDMNCLSFEKSCLEKFPIQNLRGIK